MVKMYLLHITLSLKICIWNPISESFSFYANCHAHANHTLKNLYSLHCAVLLSIVPYWLLHLARPSSRNVQWHKSKGNWGHSTSKNRTCIWSEKMKRNHVYWTDPLHSTEGLHGHGRDMDWGIIRDITHTQAFHEWTVIVPIWNEPSSNPWHRLHLAFTGKGSGIHTVYN